VGVVGARIPALGHELLLDGEELRHVVLDDLVGAVRIALAVADVGHERDGAPEPQVADPEERLDRLGGLVEIGVFLADGRLVRHLDEQLRVLELRLALHVLGHAGDLEQALVRRDRVLVALEEEEHLGVLVGRVGVELDDFRRRGGLVLVEQLPIDVERLGVAAAGVEVVGHREAHRPRRGRVGGLGVDHLLRRVELAELQELLEVLHLEAGAGGRILGGNVVQNHLRVFDQPVAVERVDIADLARDGLFVRGPTLLGTGGKDDGANGEGRQQKRACRDKGG